MVNLIADKGVVTELIQREMNPNRLLSEMQLILGETKNRQTMLEDYTLLCQKLGNGGVSRRVAREIINNLKSTSKKIAIVSKYPTNKPRGK